MHPVNLSDEALLAECETIRQRRSGPGGQHRNKVETAIRLLHRPTGVTGQASERRSQAENLQQALFRLRLALAVQVRSDSVDSALTSTANAEAQAAADSAAADSAAAIESTPHRHKCSPLWKSRRQGQKVVINAEHADFPRLLAEALDVLTLCSGDQQVAAECLQVSATQLLKFVQKEPTAWDAVQLLRQQHGLPRLKAFS